MTSLNIINNPIRYIFRIPWWLSGKDSACQYRRHGFNPWVRKIPQSRKWQPTAVFLGNPTERGAWWATVHGSQKSQTQLSD